MTIPGLQVARWYCRKGKTTFSALPDFAACRLGGTLDEVEQAVAASEATRPLEAAARRMRPDIELPGALRWLNRRRKAIAVSLLAAVTVAPELSGCAATITAVRDRIGSTSALIALRDLCRAQLRQMGAPIGFAHHRATKFNSRKSFQHKAGTDPPS